MSASTPTRPIRRRRRLVVGGAVVVGALALFVGADVVVARVVEGRIETALRERCEVVGADVALGGFAVLAQLAVGRLGEVRVTVPSALAGEALTLVARDVPLDAAARTDGLSAAATVPWAALAELAAGSVPFDDFELSPAGERISVSTRIAFLGQQLPVRLIADLAADGGTITVTPVTVEIAGNEMRADLVPPDGPLGSLLAPRSIDLPIPDSVELGGAVVTDAGLELELGMGAGSPDSDAATDGLCTL